jgi:hypothetical protein
VLVRVHCIDDVQRPPVPVPKPPSFVQSVLSTDSSAPQIGTPCDPQATDATGRLLSGAEVCASADVSAVSTLFCHPQTRVCEQTCSADEDCPTGWRCDPADAPLAMGAGQALCVNPSCAAVDP